MDTVFFKQSLDKDSVRAIYFAVNKLKQRKGNTVTTTGHEEDRKCAI